MGGQETVLRAALAGLTLIRKRGTSYGIFNTLYGASWIAGSFVLGFLYGIDLMFLIAYSVAMQATAFGAFFWLRMSIGR